jgi:4-hydroxybenzoyl-CoA thioesterase
VTFTHSREVTIEWGDCDPAGIVFYPRYFAMFDASTAALFAAALGMSKARWIRAHGIVGIPMVDTRAVFHIPSSFGETVRIESWVERFGRSSFDVRHRLMKGEALGAEAWEKRVWVGHHPDDPDRIKAQPIPADVVRRFGEP